MRHVNLFVPLAAVGSRQSAATTTTTACIRLVAAVAAETQLWRLAATVFATSFSWSA